VPYDQNPVFTGRDEVIRAIHKALEDNERAAIAQPQAIKGLGGIGKTQTAIEYAYKYRHEYNYVFFVLADKPENIELSYLEIAKALNLPIMDEKDITANIIIDIVKQWFKEHSKWLLILDNGDDIQMVSKYIPTGKGHVLLTTRSNAVGSIAVPIPLKKFGLAEGSLFLLRRANIILRNTTLESVDKQKLSIAEEISKEMDGLPLALDQAGAYIEEMSISLKEYLELYREEKTKLLAERGSLSDDHPSVTVTFSLALAKVAENNIAAAHLILVCAFLSPEAIPEFIFTKGGNNLGAFLSSAISSNAEFRKIVGEACRFSLIQRNAENATLEIHRVVQEVILGEMDEGTKKLWLERVIKALNIIFDE
jgi:hypothetical protein